MPDQAFSLFISYAHKNERQKDRLLTALAPLKRTGLIHSWDDWQICAGDDWKQEITDAMAQADGAIFLICENFLASDFCMDQEVEDFLQRYREEKLLILFVLGDHCGWEEFDYISRFQMAPRDGRPITSFNPHSKAYTQVKDEIKQALLDHREKYGLSPKIVAPTAPSPTNDEYQALLAKLPGQTEQLFGREDEMALLDQWRGHHGVFVWAAEGGMGKSALLRSWLEHNLWPAGTRFIGHSFYSQGSRNQTTNARGFLTAALQQLGESFDSNSDDYHLGQQLAEAAAKQSCVILLDGLEPLQHASTTDATLHGTLKDQGIIALLEGLGQQPGEAICLVSTRIKLNNRTLCNAFELRQQALKQLTPTGAVDLLDYRGVGGTTDEQIQVAQRCGHHPLSLILTAEFIHTFCGGSAALLLAKAWPAASSDADEHHATTIMGWFDTELADEQQALDRELMRLIGLFDRPAPWAALLALQNAEPIPHLTTALHKADAEQLWDALARLRQWGLLHYAADEAEPELDAHPLVREHFGQRLEQENRAGYRAVHKVLFDFFCNQPEKEQPDTLEEMEPLYRAIGHGCRAGEFQAALDDLYWDRICRGDQHYSTFQLGAYSSDLAALAGFFPYGWNNEPVSYGLSGSDRSWLIGKVAFRLMSLGRLEEAVGPRHISLNMTKKAGDWTNFCTYSEGLVDLYTPLGRWIEAEAVAREATSVARCIEVEGELRQFRSMVALSTLGRTLHNQGRLTEAGEAFLQAEALQEEYDPGSPRLCSVKGFDYGQLLQEQASEHATWKAILKRGRDSLAIFQQQQHLLSIALDHGTIGQALAVLAQPGAGQALTQAVETMRRAGKVEYQPKMHLARGGYHRDRGDTKNAWADHATALAIAQRGKMCTFLAECALLAGNLHLDEQAIPDAAKAWTEAELTIRETGYGRRLTELHLLEARLRHQQNNPQAAAQVLNTAEAQIRKIGQWGFWSMLVQVGRELGIEIPEESR